MSKTPPPESQPTKSVVSTSSCYKTCTPSSAPWKTNSLLWNWTGMRRSEEVQDLMESKQGLESRLAESERANKEWERKKELIMEDMKSLKAENKKLSTSLDYHNSKAQAFEKMKKERERLELDNQELLLSIEKMQEETTS
jgi:chromosome segregation ATPase